MNPVTPPAPPPVCAAALRLCDLPVGHPAILTHVHGSPADVERLAALGLVPGASVRVLRGGHSLAVAVGETRIALGRAWAEALTVLAA